jgi:alpha-tubulin suppressor-like RCC1 family protein
MCWGDNFYGGLGDGTNKDHNIPAAVYGDYKFTQITAGLEYTCGLCNDGTTMCWGYNFIGQLGDGTTNDRNTPVVVSGDNKFSQITAGFMHTCGIII